MKRIPKTSYLTSEEIDDLIREREAEAAALPPGESRQGVLKQVAQLRVYVAAKRWLAAPTEQPARERARVKQNAP